MLGLALMGCNTMGAVVLLTAATAIGGASASGALACIVDLSPNFAGELQAIQDKIKV